MTLKLVAQRQAFEWPATTNYRGCLGEVLRLWCFKSQDSPDTYSQWGNKQLVIGAITATTDEEILFIKHPIWTRQ